MMHGEVPSDDEVVAALEKLNATVTAFTLCAVLAANGHARRDSLLAIQRAVERRKVTENNDGTLSAIRHTVAA